VEIKGESVPISQIKGEFDNVIITGEVFNVETKVLKNNSQIVISGSRRVEKLVMSTRFHKIELRNSTE